MLEKIFRVHPEVCKYSHLSYSQRSFPFNGHSVIHFLKRTQEGDPALLYYYFQDLIYSLESKIILWYLFDENYFDNKSLFERSQKIFEAEKSLRLNLNPRNAIFFHSDFTEKDNRHLQHLSKNSALGSKHQRNK